MYVMVLWVCPFFMSSAGRVVPSAEGGEEASMNLLVTWRLGTVLPRSQTRFEQVKS